MPCSSSALISVRLGEARRRLGEVLLRLEGRRAAAPLPRLQLRQHRHALVLLVVLALDVDRRKPSKTASRAGMEGVSARLDVATWSKRAGAIWLADARFQIRS